MYLMKKSLKLNEASRLFSYLRPYRGWMTIGIIALVCGTILGLVFPWILQNLVDAVFAQNDMAELNRITLILIATFLLRSIFYYFQGYSLAFVGERIVVDLRIQVYQQLSSLSLRFYSERRIGELVSRLSSDVTMVRTALTNNVATVLSQSLSFIGSLTLMLILNWRLTLFILLLAPILAISAVLFGTRLRKLSTKVQDKLADSTAIAEEALTGIRVVKAFTREDYEVQRYGKVVETTFTTTMQMAKIRSAFGPLVSFLAFGSLAAILWFGGREVLFGRLTGGQLIAFLVYGINIAASIGAFANLYTQLQEAAGASRRIFELIDEKPEIISIPNAFSMNEIKGNIEFRDVSFGYEGSNHVLQSINIDIQPGEVLALVGPSGAGKSTLFNLIPRFYDPSRGDIYIDGINLREISVSSIRSFIGLVPQETHLFSGTIRENLLYGRLDANENDIENAAQAANAEEFIIQLPQGYETYVGERGVKLSGGQRQRIAIARALLKDPCILLLDEATSSLDSESEGLVQEALERLMRGRTTIIIAHRLSTVMLADRIAVLDKGHLVEVGSHQDLMANDQLYAHLYNLQFARQYTDEKIL